MISSKINCVGLVRSYVFKDVARTMFEYYNDKKFENYIQTLRTEVLCDIYTDYAIIGNQFNIIKKELMKRIYKNNPSIHLNPCINNLNNFVKELSDEELNLMRIYTIFTLNSKDKLYCYGEKGLKIMENELNKREIIKNNMNIYDK